MGLDMYLNKKTYVGGNYDHNGVKGSIKLTRKAHDPKTNEIIKEPIKVNLKRVTYIEEELCYWRKSNQIHAWFVDNVQDGNDDCRNYYVDIEHIKELLSLCEAVTKQKDPSLLPSRGGFFFGSTDADEYYYDDIKRTSRELRKVIREYEKESFSIYYESSW
jgi:hypothetical protein